MTNHGLTLVGKNQDLAPNDAAEKIVLTEPALAFVADLVRTFRPRVQELLARRAERQKKFDAGVLPDFLPETANVRDGGWRCAAQPELLLDRRVEITGPVDRKMIINALNSGANVFMADFEDSTTPTWPNLVEGQKNLFDAVRRAITFEQNGKHYELKEKTAILFVRPRGWHLPEKHVLVDGEVAPGALVDFGLYFFHNGPELVANGAGPFFYLPKMESHLEARLWNDVFVHAQEKLGVPKGTIKATVLIETLPAAFEMDEILYELRDHSAGLNCGRWDYIFSFIKKRASDASAILPDRSQVTMDKAFLAAYVKLLIKTCHRRGVHAMGGMAAQIPIKEDPQKNEEALAKVRADKLREVQAGHDGTWVAHPGLVAVAKDAFDAHMKGKNQLSVMREDVTVAPKDLLEIHPGTRTDAGLRHNVRVGIQYIESWLRGVGCVPIYHLMEDAATAEISRAQVWQWIKHHAKLDDGTTVDAARFTKTVAEEMDRIASEVGDRFQTGKFQEARSLFERLSLAPRFEEFLTLPAYDIVIGEKS
jgi:malate synthase